MKPKKKKNHRYNICYLSPIKENMSKLIPKYFFICSLILILGGMGICDLYAYASSGPKRSWQNKAVEEMFGETIEYGQALYWHLDYNSFAVRIPGSFFIFDYINNNPPESILEYYGPVSEGDVERSLLTGTIDPEEITDLLQNDIVIVLYSHEHPAEKTLSKSFKWREKFRKIMYIGPKEVYKQFERLVDAVVEKQEISEEERETMREEMLDLFKIAEPGKAIDIRGNKVIPLKPYYPMDEVHGIEHRGIEYVVETQNGIGMYHVGSMTCYLCTDLEVGDGMIHPSGKELRVITPQTKKITYQDGKIITIDGKKINTLAGEERKLSFAMWTMEDADPACISIWATYVTPYHYPTLLFKSGFATSSDMSKLGRITKRSKVYINEPLEQVLMKLYPQTDGIQWITSTTPEEQEKELRKSMAEENKDWGLKLEEELRTLQCNGQMMDYIVDLHNGKILKYYNFGMGSFPACGWHGVQSDDNRVRGFSTHFNKGSYFLGYMRDFPIFWLSPRAYKKFKEGK
ncbi:MAG: hypothetical protein ABH862_03525 [Candidatus Omnitrophota bacterium]